MTTGKFINTGAFVCQISVVRELEQSNVTRAPHCTATTYDQRKQVTRRKSIMSFTKLVTICTVCVFVAWPLRAQDTLQYCLKAKPRPGILECVGRQALTSLSVIQDADNYTITDGFRMVRDQTYTPATRALPNFLDTDPTDFRLVYIVRNIV